MTVVVLTKLPGHLPVKTRLDLPPAQARRVYTEMVRATVALARAVDPRPVVAYSPPDADPRAALPGVGACTFLPVAGGDGATCLENALAAAYRDRPLIALGGDAPDLPRLPEIAACLRDDDAVLVPTPDGGFSALGLQRPVPGLARAFRYGSDASFRSLRTFLDATGLRVSVLEPWPDVDTPEDLAAYRRRNVH